jgi:hypothetical protein
MALRDIIETIFTFENALILIPVILYVMMFITFIKFMVFNPWFTIMVLVYIIIITSININLYNSIGKLEDPNKEYKRSISKNVNIVILSFTVISLIITLLFKGGVTYVLNFTPLGKIIQQAQQVQSIVG